jgi:hypothetical protein
VVDVQSVNSSPSHGFRREISPCKKENQSEDGDGPQIKFSMRPGSISPTKVRQNYLAHINGTSEPPEFDPNTDYYKEFWRLYLQNENLVADIDQTAHQNYKMSRKMYNIKDFYDNTLVP